MKLLAISGLGASAAAGALLAALVLAPASWLSRTVQEATDGRVLLSGAQGTVWAGSAQLLLSGGAQSQSLSRLPDGLQWRVRPSWTGLQIELTAPCCAPQGVQLEVRMQGLGVALTLQDQQSRWPAQLLSGLGTPWNTLQLQGNLNLQSRNLTLNVSNQNWASTGQLVLQAQGMSSQLSTLRPMGSYTLTLQGGATPSLQLQTTQGPLRLSGEGVWVGGRLRFTGEASAEPAQEAELANLLNIMGRRNGARSVITLG